MIRNFKKGGECITLCYSLFQRIKERKATAYNDSKFPIECLSCSVRDGRFQICYSTANKLSYLKRTLKDIIKEMDPSRVGKQYGINIKNLGSKVNKEELNYTISELSKSLKKELYILAVGNVKLTSTKQGSKVSESTNLKNLAEYLSKVFPNIKEPSGKKSKPQHIKHVIPDTKIHHILKIKSNGITPMLVSDYIKKTLSIHTTPLDNSVVIWAKDSTSKLKSIKKPDRYKREMLSKKNINEQIAYHAIEANCACNHHVVKFYKLKPSKDKIIQIVMNEL